MSANLAATLAAIRAGQAIAPDAGASAERATAPLPSHPPLLPCGCDGTGWRPVPRLSGPGYAMARCLCWHRQHPEATVSRPTPKKFRRSHRDRIRDTRARQFRDD